MAKLEVPGKCDACGAQNITQDEDVLDTWFSSQLWPFSTLGWPDKNAELGYWYPNSWLMSGRDILFFLDARMIMSGLELMGDVPFRTLALHGLVRDDKGRKLSKSLGNSPDPLQLFDQYGTDAVRAAIALRYPMGRQDTKLTGDFYKAGQALITKLWNATRLLMLNAEGVPLDIDPAAIGRTFPEDRWIIGRLGVCIAAHDDYLAKSDFVHAFEVLTGFFWNDFCDWYLEIIKWRLRDPGHKQEALHVALLCERTLLKLLHPYIPFITEELWQMWGQKGLRDATSAKGEEVLAIASWPQSGQFQGDAQINDLMDCMMSVVRGVRDIRHHLNIAPKLALKGRLFVFAPEAAKGIERVLEMAKNLAFVSSLEFTTEQQTPEGFVPFRFAGGIGYIQLPQEVNPKDLKTRLESKVAKLEKALAQAEARLANASFLVNAPQELIDDNQRTAQEYRESLNKLREFSHSL